jgi:hypothetical protein
MKGVTVARRRRSSVGRAGEVERGGDVGEADRPAEVKREFGRFLGLESRLLNWAPSALRNLATAAPSRAWMGTRET